MGYKPKYVWKTDIETPEEVEGETIEEQMVRVFENNEPIETAKEMIYTERADGIADNLDIRTDKFEVAVDAMDIVSKQKLLKREKLLEEKNKKQKPSGDGEETAKAGQ